MKAALAALVLMANASAALAGACPVTITHIDWDDGARDTVSDRENDVLALDSEIPMGGGDRYPVRFRTQAGIVPLWNSGADGPVSHDWTTPLPSAADLVPGAKFDLKGNVDAWGERVPVSLTLSVAGTEQLEVAGCSYDVTRIETRRRVNGAEEDPVEVWLHLPSLLPLREASASDEAPWSRKVIALR